ncbi:MAG: glycosyltransferase [Candidatus Nanohaloarchaea archaeon]
MTVAIPTYNEAPNIEELLSRVHSILDNREHEVIVVDGGSTDGTRDKVREMAEDTPTVRLVERETRRGIGSAYREAFRLAKGDVVVQMDADFSHPPEYLPSLVESVEEGVDVAVGSRYVEGGERNDPLHRQVFPLIGSYLYRVLLRSPVRDVTSGFKAYSREAAKHISSARLPDGFHFQAASLFECLEEGYDVDEVPFTFEPRKGGEPKYSFKDLLDNVSLLLKLTARKHRRMLKFGTVGGLGVAVNTAVLFSLTELGGMYYLFSAVVAGETAMLFNFSLHDLWTFGERGGKGVRNRLSRLYRYHLFSLAGGALVIGLLWFFTEVLGVYYLASNLIAIAVVFLWNYGSNSLWTWPVED